MSVWDYDFHLDSLAFARNRGAVAYGQLVPYDLEGHDRMADQEPDLGAYEWVDTAAVRK